ncbi:hypothetical protein AB0E62_31565 [Streptomyces sp. NPDC038707]|uniref:hypothetical protein n=1 Tax=Streptomyces sp. NPDC038707 TaxID=3154329 RepID=UPI0033E93FDC
MDDDRSTHITADVFVTSSKERYPDLFGLTDGHHTGTPRARDEVLRLLNRLPRQAIDLTTTKPPAHDCSPRSLQRSQPSSRPSNDRDGRQAHPGGHLGGGRRQRPDEGGCRRP